MSIDLAIIGAGPAGLAAATEAHKHGLNVCLIDEQAQLGGQIYRNIESQPLTHKGILGPDYYAGMDLVHAFRGTRCQYIDQANVWQLGSHGQLYYSRLGQAHQIQAKHILIATGAQERPYPIPGWTLPGVMNAGAAQILLKSAGMAAENAVFAGSGPLLYLIVYQYIQAGIPVKAVLDTTPKHNYYHALRSLKGALKCWPYVKKGLSYLRAIKQAGIPHIKGVSQLAAVAGKTQTASANIGVEKVRYQQGGQTHEIPTEHLFLHQGVIPNVNLAMASGCQHTWSDQQSCWQPDVDMWGQSSQSHISIIGDGAGIAGAKSAALRGRLSALQLAFKQGKIEQAQRDKPSHLWRQQLANEIAFRGFIDRLYHIPKQHRLPQHHDTLVCRCEEVTYGDIKKAVHEGCMGPNQLKSFTRCGMGPCQGRQCGLTVTQIMAHERQESPSEVGYYRLRAPIKPLNLGELASLNTRNSEQE